MAMRYAASASTGNPSEAEAAYRIAIQLNPDHIDAYTNLGILLSGLKRTEEAAACYCKVNHAQAEAPGSAKASGAGALHAGRNRRGRENLRGMARRRTSGPDCA